MATLSIYLMTRNHGATYDEAVRVVVIAATAGDAREMGAFAEGAQDAAVWYLPTTSVARIGTATDDEKGRIVLTQGY
jgi:hypothetical protein